MKPSNHRPVVALSTIKEIKRGEYFRKVGQSGSEGLRTYIRGAYCPVNKAYECSPADDVWGSAQYLKANKTVSIGFTY